MSDRGHYIEKNAGNAYAINDVNNVPKQQWPQL